jgi:SsrA-binding protein
MSIVDNKKAFHDYFIEERYEAGLVLEGWEVKAIRAGRVNLKEAYVILKSAEPFVIGMPSAHCDRIDPWNPIHSARELLLNATKFQLIGRSAARASVPLDLHHQGRVLVIGLRRQAHESAPPRRPRVAAQQQRLCAGAHRKKHARGAFHVWGG